MAGYHFMNTGAHKPDSCAYPGVFIRGEDALRFAGWLKADADERKRLESLGVLPCTDELVRLLDSCWRGAPG